MRHPSADIWMTRHSKSHRRERKNSEADTIEQQFMIEWERLPTADSSVPKRVTWLLSALCSQYISSPNVTKPEDEQDQNLPQYEKPNEELDILGYSGNESNGRASIE
jgi:hypothetical protein